MGLKRTVSLTTHKKTWEAADIIWDLQKIPELKLRMEELKVLHGEYAIKMRKGIPVDYVFDISGAGPEGEKIIIDLKPSPAGTEIRITSKSFLPTDIIAKPGNNRENVEEIIGYIERRL